MDFINNKSINLNNKNIIVDFYFDFNGKILIIERNGEQHYEPVCFGGISIERANKNFEKQVIRDNLLRQYCLQNNIHLVEIPYWFKEDQIFLLLTEVFSLY